MASSGVGSAGGGDADRVPVRRFPAHPAAHDRLLATLTHPRTIFVPCTVIDALQVIVEYLKERIPAERMPSIAIVCGSGLGHLSDTLEDSIVFRYEDIPLFPQSTGERAATRRRAELSAFRPSRRPRGMPILRASNADLCLQ